MLADDWERLKEAVILLNGFSSQFKLLSQPIQLGTAGASRVNLDF